MSRITIRSYLSDGRGYLSAEITWNPDDPVVELVTEQKVLAPTGEIASLAVIPSASLHGYITVPIYPDDVPEPDVFSLPINLADPLPRELVGAKLPSLHYRTPYSIESLTDTEYGFRVIAGNPPGRR